ncbi:hypothetical protein [Tahibacter caeni]|uniref:hypothetical protein n=1 Tax=Tahibacter caeni TaxID=1453545 RepID=UPI0021476357|nr:hypothetical protein [Tahibacter caeni]
MSARLQTVTPLLPAGASLDAALALYVDGLGFALAWRSGDIAGITRDDIAFNLVVNDEPAWAGNASFGIGVDDLDALHAEYRLLPLRVGPLEVKLWGRREFHLIVPPGVCLQFHQTDRGGHAAV